MPLPGRAKKVTILVNQPHGEHGQTYIKILDRLKAEGAAGATAFKAIAAFGAQARVESLRLSDIVPDLPVMIVWIDTEERVERILPAIQDMVVEGLIAVEETDVAVYTTAAVPDLPIGVPVADVMTRDVVTAYPDTPMQEVVSDLLHRHFRSVPVIDDQGRVIGIITNSDLVRRGGLPVRLELLRTFETPELHDALARLAQAHTAAREVMTSPVVTVQPSLDVRHAAELMCSRSLKRLPVVDEDGHLVGIVSRADLLRAVAGERVARLPETFPDVQAQGNQPIRTIMSKDVPKVRADARLPAIVDAVLSTRLNRAVVVDDGDRVLGIITDSELVARLTPEMHAGVLTSLMQRMPFVPHSEIYPTGNRAQDLMLTDIYVANENDPIRDVLAQVLRRPRKIVPIVDGDRKLVGVVDRADLLGVLVGRE